MLCEVDGLVAHHGSGQVLHDVRLAVGAGECLAVLGRNGMGKTTMLDVLAGLHPASAGRVLLHGEDVTRLPAEERNHRGMALVPQGHRVFASLTVAENLAVAARPGPVSVGQVLEQFAILGGRRQQPAGTLSGGQQQVLVLARAMVANPGLVLMDEPTEGLDPRRVGLVGDAIGDLKDRGTGVLLVEQRLAVALDVADRVAVMERGRIESTVPVARARAHPARLRAELGLA